MTCLQMILSVNQEIETTIHLMTLNNKTGINCDYNYMEELTYLVLLTLEAFFFMLLEDGGF